MAAERSYDIHLRRRRYTPRPGVAKRLLDQAGRRDKTVHALVQPNAPVDARTRKSWLREGIRLLDPVPDGAFFATLPADPKLLDRLVGRDRPLRFAGPVEPADKIAPTLDDPPPHARGAKGLRVVVLFFGDVPVRAQRVILGRHATGGAQRVEPVNGWVTEVPEAALRRLAAEDEVKWVEEAPGRIQLDNDGVRAATATNADAVQAAPYGLSGAGVTVGHWEDTHASLTHPDFAGRIVLADGPLVSAERTVMHTESVAANGVYDVGEAIYVDMDDSGTVSAGDVRATAVGAFAAGSVVAAGDPDVGTALVLFTTTEQFADADGLYDVGDGIYRHPGAGFTVAAGDTRLTAVGAFPAGSVVAAGDADVGQSLWSLSDPHYHSTHVAGTVIGSGANSALRGGSANQWKGVAPGAVLRSYRNQYPLDADYVDAAANGTTLSTNSWGFTHMHNITVPTQAYDVTTSLYDAVISGRRSDGTASGLVAPILVVGSAGNQGRPERHAENVTANARFDAGEAIYVDNDDSGSVNAADSFRSGTAQPAGTPLVNFGFDERHDETAGSEGTYQSTEAIYRDADLSGTVSAGDVRLTAVGAFPAGSVVAAGDADVGRRLRYFRMWGNVRVPNCAKDTVVVANVGSDDARPSATSSRGPTLDGRVKPDIAGPGSQNSGDFGVTSTQPRGLYAGLTGTSMSTPAVTGVLALVTERYRQLCNGSTPAPHTLRALLVHGAADLTTIPNVPGAFTGPDFTSGYGRARAKESCDLVPHHRTGSAAALGDTDYTITVGRVAGLKVTLAWDDPAWTANAAPSPATGVLQNDLDLLLIGPDGTQYTPWVLNPNDPAQPATRAVVPAGMLVPAAARDRRNTVEQVVVDDAAAGTWTVRVSAAMLNLGPQPYTIVCEFIPPQDSPCAAAPAGDVFLRDNTGDTGTVPSTGTMWLSPDVWNRQHADGMTTHENPEYGQPNALYANVRNLSGVTVGHTSIDVWIAPASSGLAWPASFRYLGRFAVPNLPAGTTQQVGPIVWDPPSPVPSDHFCLYVRAASPQDPITYAETANVGTNAANSNNIVWRNVNVVDLHSSTSVSFLLRNIGRKAAEVELVVRTPAALLKVGQVGVRFAPALEDRLGGHPKVERPRPLLGLKGFTDPDPADIARYLRRPRLLDGTGIAPQRWVTKPEVRMPGIRLDAFEAHPVTLTFSSEQRKEQEFVVDVVQVVDGEEVGGVRYLVRTHK